MAVVGVELSAREGDGSVLQQTPQTMEESPPYTLTEKGTTADVVVMLSTAWVMATIVGVFSGRSRRHLTEINRLAMPPI